MWLAMLALGAALDAPPLAQRSYVLLGTEACVEAAEVVGPLDLTLVSVESLSWSGCRVTVRGPLDKVRAMDQFVEDERVTRGAGSIE